MKKWILLVLALLVAVSVGASEFKNGQTVGTRSHSGTIVGGWYSADSTGRYLLFDINGNLKGVDADRDRDFGQVLPTGITGLTIAAGTTARSQLVDVSQYNNVTLILTWTTAAAADSDSVNVALHVFNMASGTWATDDAQVAPFIFNPYTRGVAAVGDTSIVALADFPLLAQNASTGTRLATPNLYLYRNTGTMLTATGSAVPVYGLGKIPRLWVPNGGVAIDLSALCGSMKFNYLGLRLSNWGNTKSLVNVKATLWVSR